MILDNSIISKNIDIIITALLHSDRVFCVYKPLFKSNSVTLKWETNFDGVHYPATKDYPLGVFLTDNTNDMLKLVLKLMEEFNL